ncbi:MAG: DNA internalization-related competence protein ComEC/Rec2 [Clostridia bacterium]|nr:DNA internalization-related competence protein ComEC/Rec2 [Clostridia bacterium]
MFFSKIIIWEPKVITLLVMTFILLPASFCAVVRAAYGKNVVILAIVPSFIFLGAFITHVKTDPELHQAYPYAGSEVTIYGTVISPVKSYDGNVSYTLRASRISCGGKELNISEKIKITSEKSAAAGVAVVVSGKLKEISYPKNSTSFNSRRYNLRRGIFFSLFAEECSVSDETFSLRLSDRLSLFTSVITDNFINRFNPEQAPLLKGIIMNNKSEIPEAETEMMLRSGTYRYIYCPYLHISLLMLIISMLFKRNKSKTAALLCVFLLYLCLNMTVPSAWKISLFLGLSYFITLKSGVRDIKAALYLTVLLTGIVSPLTLTEPGFILSASCTVLIRSFSKPLSEFLMRLVRHRRLSGLLSVYIIIIFAAAPLSSFMGYGLTPYSFLLGFILMPLTAIVYILFYLSAGISVLTGAFFDFGLPCFLKLIRLISGFAAQLPFASVHFGKCSLMFIAAFYSALLFVRLRMLRMRAARPAGAACAVLCAVFAASFIYGIGDAELTFINVGQGDCALLRLPGGKTAMIDGGGSPVYSDYSIGEAEVLPYLEAHGINKIDFAIVSHYHKDHVDGVITVIQNVKVKELFIPDYLPNSKYRDIIEKEAQSRGVKITPVGGTQSIDLTDRLRADFYYTGLGSEKDENDNSLVVKLSFDEISMLFTGDITRLSENNLDIYDADILKVPHHGSKTSSSEDFIKKASPDFAVICLGENNTYGFPAEPVLRRYKDAGSIICRTDKYGDIHFIMNGKRIKRVYGFKEWNIYGGFAHASGTEKPAE